MIIVMDCWLRKFIYFHICDTKVYGLFELAIAMHSSNDILVNSDALIQTHNCGVVEIMQHVKTIASKFKP